MATRAGGDSETDVSVKLTAPVIVAGSPHPIIATLEGAKSANYAVEVEEGFTLTVKPLDLTDQDGDGTPDSPDPGNPDKDVDSDGDIDDGDGDGAIDVTYGNVHITMVPAKAPYTGRAHEPQITVTYQADASGEITLTRDLDYTVTYQGNTTGGQMVEVGRYTVLIQGAGNYAGTFLLNYAITAQGGGGGGSGGGSGGGGGGGHGGEEDFPVADPDHTGVSQWLNTVDHLAYLNGYPDGRFGPGGSMTRAEVAQMFYNLLLNQEAEITASFADVPESAWYARAVNTLASLGILQGVADNQFSPQRAITRAEFTAIAMRFATLKTGGKNIFSDVSRDQWYYDYVVGSIRYGWINGYENGTFRPDKTITRAEVTTIANRMLGRAADQDYVDSHLSQLRGFPDVSASNWAYYQIVEATNAHAYSKASGAEDWTALRK